MKHDVVMDTPVSELYMLIMQAMTYFLPLFLVFSKTSPFSLNLFWIYLGNHFFTTKYSMKTAAVVAENKIALYSYCKHK